MIGAGLQSAGTSLAGIGEFEPTSASPTLESGARFIGQSGDHEVDPQTHGFARMNSIRQRIIIALSTPLNSSALQDFGVLDPRKVGTTFGAAMRNSVRAALVHLTSTGEIEIEQIEIERVNANRTIRTVYYRELATDRRDSATVG